MRWFRNPFLNLQVSMGTFVQQTSFKYPTLCHRTIIVWLISTTLEAHLSSMLKGRMFLQSRSLPRLYLPPAPASWYFPVQEKSAQLMGTKLKDFPSLKSEQGREEFQNTKALARVLVQLARRGLRERVWPSLRALRQPSLPQILGLITSDTVVSPGLPAPFVFKPVSIQR